MVVIFGFNCLEIRVSYFCKIKVWTQGVACFVIKGSDIRVSAFCNDAARGYRFRMKEHMGDDT